MSDPNIERLERENDELRAAIEEGKRDSAAYLERTKAMLTRPDRMTYEDRCEFERLESADIEQGKRIADQLATIAALRAALKEAADCAEVGWAAAFPGAPPERVRDDIARWRKLAGSGE